MKVLIDIGHPAHVHLFKNFSLLMQAKGHSIFFTARDREFVKYLLDDFQSQYEITSKHSTSLAGKILGLLKNIIKILYRTIIFKPDLFLSHGSIAAAQVAWITNRPHISLEDTFNFEQIKLYKPFTRHILTSSYQHPYLGDKNIKYEGYHELAYLHPNYFRSRPEIVQNLDLNMNDKFVIIRFVSWGASHDKRSKGISLANKYRIISEFEKYAKVYISSESHLPPELARYQLNFPPEKMHNLMEQATLIFGESATMVAEGAMLGVPGIFIDRTGRYYTKELEEKYNLVFNYSETNEDQIRAIDKGIEVLSNDLSKVYFKSKQKQMLQEKIDVTSFLVWFIENYPKSSKEMKINPDIQKQFL